MLKGNITLDTKGLTQFTDQFQKRVLKKAIRRGAKLVQDAVKGTVPVATGTLKQSIATKVDAIKGKTVVYGVVGPRAKFVKVVKGHKKQPARYAHFVQRDSHFLNTAWSGRKTQYIKAVQDTIAEEIKAMLS